MIWCRNTYVIDGDLLRSGDNAKLIFPIEDMNFCIRLIDWEDRKSNLVVLKHKNDDHYDE